MNAVTQITTKAWPGEGQRWVTEPRRHAPGLDSLLAWASEQGASRISFHTGKPVWLRIHGRNHPVTQRTLDEAEVAAIANHLYGADGTARLQGGKDFDVAYEIHVSRSGRLRYRLNATSTRVSRGMGANIVLRPIPDLPPPLENQLVERMILDNCRPASGMVIVSGATGSGKSTLIGGITVDKLLDPEGHYNILEAAAPVEFLLDRLKGPSSTIDQCEIPRDLPSFEAFIRGTTRREPTDIIVGECRDTATMSASLNAAMLGATLTTTIHADTVPLTIQRIAALCGNEERENLLSSAAQSLRLIVNQRLAFSTDGRRTALREILVFDEELRGQLMRTDAKDWPDLTKHAVRERGQSYEVAIRKALEDGRITEATAAREMRRTKG
ncbi:Twitching mobility protein [Roseomonas sp. TAS13]|uniref:type IV pilus twitching motility protein PilT n=1 Tax=Roseomonas TaxID=125216 RepID=UPI000962A53B|nr:MULTISPECIES: ATPase, T2SS/T4P/T4SS family [Roseomonas]MCG7351410.1 Flp pilus assembly complex ATPase component TadA [Roseomonas mucosa]MCG7358069.1 Flp pilus assembly complex ATPase component TadA [Roseomonas mucosa]GAV36437.1 Twitching mobility protein [Roseomonas sp. TAS13]